MRETADAIRMLERDFREIFGGRLQSLVKYGDDVGALHALAVVETLTSDDLRACAARVAAWHDAKLATPLVLAAHEFGRSLDAFPLEFGAILAAHRLVAGSDPFATLTVDPADVRRAVEVQARSHLLHLREGYLEAGGRASALALLIEQSAPAFAALLTSLARLEGQGSHDAAAAARHAERLLNVPAGAASDVVKLADGHDLPSHDAERVFPGYLDAVEKLVSYVDRWSRA